MAAAALAWRPAERSSWNAGLKAVAIHSHARPSQQPWLAVLWQRASGAARQHRFLLQTSQISHLEDRPRHLDPRAMRWRFSGLRCHLRPEAMPAALVAVWHQS